MRSYGRRKEKEGRIGGGALICTGRYFPSHLHGKKKWQGKMKEGRRANPALLMGEP